MTNKTEMVSVPREPTQAMLDAARDWSVKKYGLGIGDEAAAGCWQAMLLAAPAEDVRAVVEEPVLWVLFYRGGNKGPAVFIPGFAQTDKESAEKVAAQDLGHPEVMPLYRRPQRPFAMPERYERLHVSEYRSGWNDCLDAVEELNK